MKRNKLVAMTGWKYEPEWMIDQMKENMPWVDEWAILDCRKRDELWIHEGDYRLALREMARKMKADWVLVCAPDERYEKDAGEKIRKLIDHNTDDVVYGVKLLELFHPLWYRFDGIWGNKMRYRLYPLKDNQVMEYSRIQCKPCPVGMETIDTDVVAYHLKMIEPENRELRTKVFKILDPTNKHQHVGYDYLTQEDDSNLARIDPNRMYYPEYKKYIFEVPEKYLQVNNENENFSDGINGASGQQPDQQTP